MEFSEHLRLLARPIWQAQHNHPFVRGIADGSLELERFQFWIRQDYIFLIEYCRLFGLAAARAPDFETLARFADLLQSTARTEMELHRSYAAEFAISAADLEHSEMAPTTRAYTDFLIRVAATGNFDELVAALLPCMWGFSEIGTRLAAGPRPSDHRYVAWIETYASPDFAQLAEWCRRLLDRMASDAGEESRRRMEEAFLTSSRYELAFWEAAWNQQQDWPGTPEGDGHTSGMRIARSDYAEERNHPSKSEKEE